MKIATLQKFTGGEVSCIVDGVYQSDFTTPEDAQAWLETYHAKRVHDGKPYIKNGKNDTVSGRWEVDDNADEVIADDDDEPYCYNCKDFQNVEPTIAYRTEYGIPLCDTCFERRQESNDDEVNMHECKFCHCLDETDSAHSCLAFTDAGNAPDDTPEHKLWEAVMSGIDTGFVNIDGSEE